MMTTPIRAVDARVLPFAPDQIWPVLADVNGYPQWYPPSLHLHVRAVTADGIGSEVELRPRGERAFRCRVESLDQIHSKLMRKALMSLEREVRRRS